VDAARIVADAPDGEISVRIGTMFQAKLLPAIRKMNSLAINGCQLNQMLPISSVGMARS
jgi:hypothetical protein